MRPLAGTDLVYIPRVAERLAKANADRFLARILTPAEIAYCAGRADKVAGCYAAKEAVAKALGTGIWGAGGVDFKDIELERDEAGKPFIRLSGKALSAATALGVTAQDISISHDGDYAIAFCVMLVNNSSESSKQ